MRATERRHWGNQTEEYHKRIQRTGGQGDIAGKERTKERTKEKGYRSDLLRAVNYATYPEELSLWPAKSVVKESEDVELCVYTT